VFLRVLVAAAFFRAVPVPAAFFRIEGGVEVAVAGVAKVAT
jgi:hypothetical protein